jgi:hypothetical protein
MSQSPLTTDDFVFLDALAREVRANADQYSAAAKQITERYSLAACRQRGADIRRRTRVETQLGAPIRKARHRASDFTPVRRLGLAVQSHRQLYLDDRSYALWLDRVAALEIVFLTWLMVDTDSHELKALKCEFQQFPWAFNTKIKDQLLQGRQVVAADLLDEMWLELTHAAWVKIEKPGADESVPSQGGMSWEEAQESWAQGRGPKVFQRAVCAVRNASYSLSYSRLYGTRLHLVKRIVRADSACSRGFHPITNGIFPR